MKYAILQKELVVPEVEHLKNAFNVCPELTGIDAQTSANDAYGILLRGLKLEQASVLQDAMLKEGVDTAIVGESELPMLTPGRIGRQAQFDASQLTLFDSMRQPSRVAWPDIMLIASGLVKTRDKQQLMLEIFLRDRAGRFSIDGGVFTYDHLGPRLSEDQPTNFVLLLQDIVQHAPHAGLNRGACAACQKPPELFPYPNKPAFNEELVWMLWRIEQAGR